MIAKESIMHHSPRWRLKAKPMEGRETQTPKRELIWWQSWEFYLIALLAVGLRLYRIDTAQYMTDQNTFYQMAHNALANGLWPISANRASTGPLIPPLFVYVMMIPSAITSNPVAGNILIALCNVAAVLLTYIFVRCYYGRLAGAISALLYATAVNVIIFSRDIWQPDLLPLFVILLLFMLFRGVVKGKRYWFLPATLLIGAMYQFHSTAVYLLAPLLVAVVLAYKTIRWRELPLAALGLLLLFAPYIYLERHNQYADVRRLFQLAVQPARFSSDALELYRVFVQSFVLNPLHQHADTHLIPSNEHSILLTTPLRFIAQFTQPESWLMDLLLVGGISTVIVLILWSGRFREQGGMPGWWKELLASPQRKGLILLLVWQGMVLFMMHHPVDVFIYIHYLTYLLPGPFILIGLLLANVVKLAQWRWSSRERMVHYGLYVGVGLIVGMQTVASAGWLVDHALGNFASNYAKPEYFDLATVQRIVNEADQVAQQQHLSRAYIDIHGEDESAVRYLAQFVHTQLVVFDSQQCMVLPDAKSGPVVYVTDPNREDIDALLKRYTAARLVEEIQHPGGVPFKLYVLSAKPEPRPALQLSVGVQLLSPQADVLSSPGRASQWVATRWTVQNMQVPQPRTTYQYVFNSQLEGGTTGGQQQLCELSRTWPGDQLIPFFKLVGNAPRHLVTQVQTFSSGPQHYDRGSLKLVTSSSVDTSRITLQTANGRKIISLSISVVNAPASS
jgi:4-amino-4-deoxy-L-arabinose transferase-like glycosyltransferase